MILGIYAIKDTKVGFMQPFIQANNPVAVREFTNLINSPRESAISVNYQDMELYQIGTYNQDTGALTSDVQYLIKGVDVKRVEA